MPAKAGIFLKLGTTCQSKRFVVERFVLETLRFPKPLGSVNLNNDLIKEGYSTTTNWKVKNSKSFRRQYLIFCIDFSSNLLDVFIRRVLFHIESEPNPSVLTCFDSLSSSFEVNVIIVTT